jgi:hypothetical protein
MARTAHPNSCSSKKRTPKCKKCQQKATSQCVFVHGQVLVGKAAGRSSELKLLQLDPNALNRRNSEIEARPLSPLRNRPLESHQHAQKKNRIEIQQVERSPAALPAVERDENTPPANSSIRKQPGGLPRELPAPVFQLCVPMLHRHRSFHLHRHKQTREVQRFRPRGTQECAVQSDEKLELMACLSDSRRKGRSSRLFVTEHGFSRRWVLWEWDGAAAGAPDIPIAHAPTGWGIDARPTALDAAFLKGLCGGDWRVMYRWAAPYNWCEGRVKSVVGAAKDCKIRVHYTCDGKDSTSQLSIDKYGVQGDWVALTRARKRKRMEQRA